MNNAAAQGLIQAGRAYTGAHVCESKQHPGLMRLAWNHARFQANIQCQGHQNWNGRQVEARRLLGNLAFAEICAESWEWQTKDTMYNLGMEMFKCWRKSPGHWRVASKKHRFFGVGMAMGQNGIWYSCIIVGD